MSINAGTAYIDIVPDMSKFNSGVSAGVKKAGSKGSSVMSSAKKLGAAVGITMGAGVAFDFLKGAWEDFDKARASLNSFNGALERTGQAAAINSDEFNQWLETFGDNIGKDDELLRPMAEHLVNAFDFTKFGPNATAVLEQMTQGILDFSQGSGKATGMVQKLFLSILNDPKSALSQLKKLGIITEDQVTHFKHLIDKGDAARVSMELLDAATKHYNGSAEKAATETDKLAARWGNFKEKIGGFIETVIEDFVRGLPLVENAINPVMDRIANFAIAIINDVVMAANGVIRAIAFLNPFGGAGIPTFDHIPYVHSDYNFVGDPKGHGGTSTTRGGRTGGGGGGHGREATTTGLNVTITDSNLGLVMQGTIDDHEAAKNRQSRARRS
jgi:hypothetical protein